MQPKESHMLNAKDIQCENDLATLLAQCGFDSDPPNLSVMWRQWARKWDGRIPISRYLRGFPSMQYYVAVSGDTFQFYALHPRDEWFILVHELRGDTTREALAAMVRAAIHTYMSRTSW